MPCQMCYMKEQIHVIVLLLVTSQFMSQQFQLQHFQILPW